MIKGNEQLGNIENLMMLDNEKAELTCSISAYYIYIDIGFTKKEAIEMSGLQKYEDKL